MENKRTCTFSFFRWDSHTELFAFFDLGIWRQAAGTLCVERFIQFYTDQFETLQALLSWSVDVMWFWHYRQINFLSLFWLLNLAICGA